MTKKEYIGKLEEAVKYLSENDAVMRKIIERYPFCTIRPHKNYFESLTDSIISQQLSVKAASSIFNKFKAFYGGVFPDEDMILKTKHEDLRMCGLSNAKAVYVKDLCTKIKDGTVKLDKFNKLPDEEIISELVKVKGIGEWTAHMFLMFCLGRLDVLPVGDLGIKKAVMNNYKLSEMPDAKKIEEIAKKRKWKPYRTVASWYLWRSLENT